jgi:hypothetical protein
MSRATAPAKLRANLPVVETYALFRAKTPKKQCLSPETPAKTPKKQCLNPETPKKTQTSR